MHKLEIKNKLGLDFSFEEFIDLLLTSFHVAVHKFIKMSAHKNSELFELLLKYKSKHGTYSGISDSPGQSVTCSN